MDKYKLNPHDTYYIGDRKLDVEVAKNAGIRSINFTQESSPINQKIQDLRDLETLFTK